MAECPRCRTEKQELTLNGRQVSLCLHTGCIMERWLAQYEGCNHDLETVGENMMECTKCGMGATPSYEKYP